MILTQEQGEIRHKVTKLYDEAVLPKRAREDETGYDLVTHRYEIMGEKICFFFGIAVEPAKGYDFQIRARSSIHKTPFRLCNGVGTIDAPFRGELRVFCDILQGTKYSNEALDSALIGKSFFQLVESFVQTNTGFEEVTKEELSQTERGEGGFGSTNL